MIQTNLDDLKLRRVAYLTDSALNTVRALAIRERDRKRVDLSRIKNALIKSGKKLVESEYMAYWKSLEEQGIGSIIYGRRDKPDMFEFHYSLHKLVKASLKEEEYAELQKTKQENIENRPKKDRKKASKKVNQEQPHKDASQIVVCIRNFRKNFNLTFAVPSDITSEEIEIVKDTIQAVKAG